VEYRGARGKRCLKGLLVAEGESGAFVFKRGRRTWTVRSTEDDGLAIPCPNSATETYTEADVAAQPPSCGGFSASTVCTLGDCP
jgi:hypothetical protein